MGQDTVISIAQLAATEPSATSTQNVMDGYTLSSNAKPIWQRATYPPRISLNGLLVGLLCCMGVILSGFMPFTLPSPLNIWAANPSNIQYTLQLPFMLAVATLLGPFMGPAAILLFLITGLAFLPLFANGGGWHYVFEPGFGYLAGTFFVGLWLSRTYHRALQKTELGSRSLRLLKKAMVAVIALHLLGGLYLLTLTVLGFLAWSDLGGWAFGLSIGKLPYDLLATMILLGLVRQIRLGLWLVLY